MSYSRIARFYNLLETVTIGQPLLDARLTHLDHLAQGPKIQHALLVGEGNGSFLVPFARGFPDAQITVVDESAEMLAVAQARLAAAGLDDERIVFRRVDMTTEILPEACYDFIVTLFFFDNFTEVTVRKIVLVLERVATPTAQWLLSDFQIPERGWRRGGGWLARPMGSDPTTVAGGPPNLVPARQIPHGRPPRDGDEMEYHWVDIRPVGGGIHKRTMKEMIPLNYI